MPLSIGQSSVPRELRGAAAIAFNPSCSRYRPLGATGLTMDLAPRFILDPVHPRLRRFPTRMRPWIRQLGFAVVLLVTLAWTSPAPASTAYTELRVEGMTCGTCVSRVTAALSKVPGVLKADVSLAEGRAYIQLDGDASQARISRFITSRASVGSTGELVIINSAPGLVRSSHGTFCHTLSTRLRAARHAPRVRSHRSRFRRSRSTDSRRMLSSARAKSPCKSAL